MNTLQLQATTPPVATQLDDETVALIRASLAPATMRAYATDWRIFRRWCELHGHQALPAHETVVARFLGDQVKLLRPDGMPACGPSTLNRRLAAIKYFHEAADLDSPTVKKLVTATLQGIRRTRKAAPTRRKTAATFDKVEAMVCRCDVRRLSGMRDRALLLLGFAGAFRRSELVGLQVSDLQETPEGLRITIRSSKTDQEGLGQEIAVPNGRLQVVAAVKAWLTAAGIESGPVFRAVSRSGTVGATALSDRMVANIVKSRAALAGFDPAGFAGHSLRAGFVTSAAETGATTWKIMAQTRHKSVQTVAGYVRSAELFQHHAGAAFL